jgi:hypothetical protein
MFGVRHEIVNFHIIMASRTWCQKKDLLKENVKKPIWHPSSQFLETPETDEPRKESRNSNWLRTRFACKVRGGHGLWEVDDGMVPCGHLCYSGSELADKRFLGLDTIRLGSTQSQRRVRLFGGKSQIWSADYANIDGAGGVCDRERSREAVGVLRATHPEAIKFIIGWAFIMLVIVYPMGPPKIPPSIVPVKRGR